MSYRTREAAALLLGDSTVTLHTDRVKKDILTFLWRAKNLEIDFEVPVCEAEYVKDIGHTIYGWPMVARISRIPKSADYWQFRIFIDSADTHMGYMVYGTTIQDKSVEAPDVFTRQIVTIPDEIPMANMVLASEGMIVTAIHPAAVGKIDSTLAHVTVTYRGKLVHQSYECLVDDARIIIYKDELYTYALRVSEDKDTFVFALHAHAAGDVHRSLKLGVVEDSIVAVEQGANDLPDPEDAKPVTVDEANRALEIVDKYLKQ